MIFYTINTPTIQLGTISIVSVIENLHLEEMPKRTTKKIGICNVEFPDISRKKYFSWRSSDPMDTLEDSVEFFPTTENQIFEKRIFRAWANWFFQDQLIEIKTKTSWQYRQISKNSLSWYEIYLQIKSGSKSLRCENFEWSLCKEHN